MTGDPCFRRDLRPAPPACVLAAEPCVLDATDSSRPGRAGHPHTLTGPHRLSPARETTRWCHPAAERLTASWPQRDHPVQERRGAEMTADMSDATTGPVVPEQRGVRDHARGEVLDRHARLTKNGRPIFCRPSRAEIEGWVLPRAGPRFGRQGHLLHPGGRRGRRPRAGVARRPRVALLPLRPLARRPLPPHHRRRPHRPPAAAPAHPPAARPAQLLTDDHRAARLRHAGAGPDRSTAHLRRALLAGRVDVG